MSRSVLADIFGERRKLSAAEQLLADVDPDLARVARKLRSGSDLSPTERLAAARAIERVLEVATSKPESKRGRKPTASAFDSWAYEAVERACARKRLSRTRPAAFSVVAEQAGEGKTAAQVEKAYQREAKRRGNTRIKK